MSRIQQFPKQAISRYGFIEIDDSEDEHQESTAELLSIMASPPQPQRSSRKTQEQVRKPKASRDATPVVRRSARTKAENSPIYNMKVHPSLDPCLGHRRVWRKHLAENSSQTNHPVAQTSIEALIHASSKPLVETSVETSLEPEIEPEIRSTYESSNEPSSEDDDNADAEPSSSDMRRSQRSLARRHVNYSLLSQPIDYEIGWKPSMAIKLPIKRRRSVLKQASKDRHQELPGAQDDDALLQESNFLTVGTPHSRTLSLELGESNESQDSYTLDLGGTTPSDYGMHAHSEDDKHEHDGESVMGSSLSRTLSAEQDMNDDESVDFEFGFSGNIDSILGQSRPKLQSQFGNMRQQHRTIR